MITFDWNFVIESVAKLIAGAFCGFILGLERKSHSRVVGTRTLILITVSTTLLAIVSYWMAHGPYYAGKVDGDPTRISAGVISGIGFLGGGAIMRQGLNIKGLTSAAMIWVAASLGLAIGVGLYIQSAVTLVMVLVLIITLEKFEYKFFPANLSKTLHLSFEENDIDMAKIKETIQKNRFVVADLNVTHDISKKMVILHYSVKAPKEDDFSNLVEDLKKLGPLTELSITD